MAQGTNAAVREPVLARATVPASGPQVPSVGRLARLALAGRRHVLAVLAVAVLAYLVVLPLVSIVTGSFKPDGLLHSEGWTIAHYVAAYTSSATYQMLGNSLILGVGAAAIATTLGAALAWLLERTDLPGARVFRMLIIATIAVPPLLLAIGYILLFSPTIGFISTFVRHLTGGLVTPSIYNLPGMVVVQALAFTPTSFLLISPVFSTADSSVEEAAAICGASRWTIFRRITLPMARPNIIGAAIFNFALTLLVFDVPGLLGMRANIYVLSTKVYVLLHGEIGLPDYGQASALAAIPIAVLLPLTIAYRKVLARGDRYISIAGKGYRPRRTRLGKWRRPSLALVVLYFLFTTVLPLGALIVTSFLPYYQQITGKALSSAGFGNYSHLFSDPTVLQSLRNTGEMVVVVATVLALGSPVLSWLATRPNSRLGKAVDVLSFVPIAVSFTILGFGLVTVYLTLKQLHLYGTVWIIALAHITIFLSFATRLMNGAILQIDPSLYEAAKTSGAPAFTAFRRIIFRLLRPSVLIVWIWVLATSVNELSGALMLNGANNSVLTVTLWDLWQGNSPTEGAALGVFILAGLLVIVALWSRLMRRMSQLD